ncbi:hypothetical protein [Collimonas humicola]|uniref:hypothetical protein n=1 Tax=Collimonas humicola TaxID=2825886 RepID=UPI001B8C88BA|nr:hypothetical protein [Collimonas humicola]
MTQTMKQLEAKRRFDQLVVEIKALESDNPDLAVQVFEKQSAVAASSVPRPHRRAILRRVVLRLRSGDIWVEKTGADWQGSEPWSDATMRAGVDTMPRDVAPPVDFIEADV